MVDLNLYEKFCVNSPHVVSETIEGETIIMHHGSGHYFNTAGPGAVIWTAIEEAQTAAAIAGRLVACYQVEETDAQSAVARFLSTLQDHGLVRAGGEGQPRRFAPPAVRDPFSEPEIQAHSDLADMLLLDPIHDVDETGWPAPKP